MNKPILFTLAIAVLFVTASCMRFEKIDYDKTGAPSIKALPRQKMILAGSRGTAEKIAGDCIGSLYSVYFAMKYKGKVMAAARARWPILPDTDKGEWVGIFGIPVPEEITAVPETGKKTAVEVKLGYWDYGDTAEIVHFGGYDAEKPAVDKLLQYIREKGYVTAGPHEEVYIKGPGMFGKGDPKKYITLIRYQVKKAEIPLKSRKKQL